VSSQDGRAVLVTGPSRGIGAAIAGRLVGRSASVAVSYAASAPEADAVTRRIRAVGGMARFIRAPRPRYSATGPVVVRIPNSEAHAGVERSDGREAA
jgi:NAD(P)-dependent dehydrogenase (short-subunit alcohol dehydrogenase family)